MGRPARKVHTHPATSNGVAVTTVHSRRGLRVNGTQSSKNVQVASLVYRYSIPVLPVGQLDSRKRPRSIKNYYFFIAISSMVIYTTSDHSNARVRIDNCFGTSFSGVNVPFFWSLATRTVDAPKKSTKSRKKFTNEY